MRAAPSNLPPLAVTGSTGALGGLVAAELAAGGEATRVEQRLLVRDAARAPVLAGATPAMFRSYADTESAGEALAGVEVLLMVSAAESADRLDQHRAFVDAAGSAEVRHLVYTSFLGAAPDATFTLARDHFATEEHIRASGMDYTFLRDAFYLDFLPELVGDDGVIRGPAGDGRVAAVTRADVARVAAAVLRQPADHLGATYDLTGPEALTLAEAAELISAVRGTKVSYHDETLAEAYRSRARWGAPDWQNDAWVSTYTAIAAGEMGTVSGDVEAITGRAATALAQWLRSEEDRPELGG